MFGWNFGLGMTSLGWFGFLELVEWERWGRSLQLLVEKLFVKLDLYS